jgi:hypothetical protein
MLLVIVDIGFMALGGKHSLPDFERSLESSARISS